MSENGNKIKEAVAILYDMEINNYKMTRTIMRLNYEISCLGKPQKIDRPSKPSYPQSDISGNTRGLSASAGFVIGGMIGMMVGCSSVPGGLGIFEGLAGAALGSLLGALIGFLIAKAYLKSKDDEEYEKDMESYNLAVGIYEVRLSMDKERVENELHQKKILEAERKSLIERKQKAEQILAGFYMKAGINQNFRNLIPIAKMHEIISLGITYNLEGENGLNDRVRKELREDAFYAKLEEISQRLDTLINKTDRLYGEILNLNSQCENLIGATMQSAQLAVNNNALLSEAVKNTRIAAYNSERIAAEQRYQSFMMTYNF